MVNKCFVLRKEVINVFHEKYYIPTIEKLFFSSGSCQNYWFNGMWED